MVGRKELVFPKTSACSLREQLARKIVNHVKLQGHTYVELREDGKKVLFFCTLCLAQCHSDSILFDHLKGSIHSERYAAAKATLLKPNPWPFNDGVYFFHESTEQPKEIPSLNADRVKWLDTQMSDEYNLAIVPHVENMQSGSSGNNSPNMFDSDGVDSDCANNSDDTGSNSNRHDYDLVIPGVLHKDEICELHVKPIGMGKIGARFYETDGASKKISSMWCEWLGKKDSGNIEDDLMTPEHDFAVVTFAYNYDLGRKGLFNDVRFLLLSNSQQDIQGARKKQRRSFSDPEDISESLSSQYDSFGEETSSSKSSTSKLQLRVYDDQLLNSRLTSSKTMRKELRKQQRIAAERMCDICKHKMLPGKDVATLVNMKTGRFVCSSRNVNGAFHIYHISCLIHWILLCEFEILTNPRVVPEVKRRSKRKCVAKKKETRKDCEMSSKSKQVTSVFCPECQGTGVNIHGDELEKPHVRLSEMFKYKIKISDARKAWMKSPEELHNCSTGFKFPLQSEETIQGKVSSLKLLHFYQADE